MAYSTTSFKIFGQQGIHAGSLQSAIEAAMQLTLDETPEADGFDVDMDSGIVTFTLRDGSTMDLAINTWGSETCIKLGNRELAKITAKWED